MKKKIGEIYNKPIVTGDKNLVTKNEIHESSLGGSSSGGGDGVKEYYYRLNTEHEQYDYAAEIVMYLMIKDFIYNGTNVHRIYGVGTDLALLLLYKGIQALCIFDCSVNNVLSQDDGDNGTTMQTVTAPKGNIKEKISQLIPDFESTVDEIFIPITKEEYESLITQ